jgi:hypothetical protein
MWWHSDPESPPKIKRVRYGSRLKLAVASANRRRKQSSLLGRLSTVHVVSGLLLFVIIALFSSVMALGTR